MSNEELVGLDTDHAGLAKFRGPDDPGYRQFTRFVIKMSKETEAEGTILDTQQILRLGFNLERYAGLGAYIFVVPI